MATIETTTQPASASSLKQAIIRHPLVAYFVLAFAGTWGVQLPMLLSQDGLGLLPYTVPSLPFMLLFLLSTYAGPFLAAFVVTATESGRAGVRDFLRRFVRWRVALRWYVVVLLGYPILYVLAAMVFMGAAPLQAVAARWTLLFTSYLPLLLLKQGLTQWAEEPGWRGFALPRLEERFGPVPGTLILGTLHMLWHLPVYTYTGGPVPLGPFDLSTFALAIAVSAMTAITWTWVYNNTGGSILLAVLLHSALNETSPLIAKLIPSYPDEASSVIYVATFVIPLVLIIATRGRLSYRGLPSGGTESAFETGATEPGRAEA